MIASALVIVPRNTTNALPLPSQATKPNGSGQPMSSTVTVAQSGAPYCRPSPFGVHLKPDWGGYPCLTHWLNWSYAVSTSDAQTAASPSLKFGGKYIGGLFDDFVLMARLRADDGMLCVQCTLFAHGRRRVCRRRCRPDRGQMAAIASRMPGRSASRTAIPGW